MMQTGLSAGAVRDPVVAGSFYTANAGRLSSEIDTYLSNAPKKTIAAKPIGLICPHAGYMYSGQVAAHAYKHLEGSRYDVVIIVAPSHRAYFSGASVDTKAGYRTPLGVVPIDAALAKNLIDRCPAVSNYEPAHAQEHSLEVQIPFLQKVLSDFKLLPIIMGDQDAETCQAVADALGTVMREHAALVVASSDLSHYHPYAKAKELDQKVIDCINAFDPQGLAANLAKHRMEACGGGPIITALLVGKQVGATRAEVVNYANSGDVSGDYSGVVGYAAGVIY